jgi:hypothetical protein
MKPEVISFKHDYHKLAQNIFTTVRGKAYFKRLKIGMQVIVEMPGVSFHATVTNLELRRVNEMPLAFLKADAEYPGFFIHSPEDFVNLLNSFRPPVWAQVELNSELTIITLQK